MTTTTAYTTLGRAVFARSLGDSSLPVRNPCRSDRSGVRRSRFIATQCDTAVQRGAARRGAARRTATPWDEVLQSVRPSGNDEAHWRVQKDAGLRLIMTQNFSPPSVLGRRVRRHRRRRRRRDASSSCRPPPHLERDASSTAVLNAGVASPNRIAWKCDN